MDALQISKQTGFFKSFDDTPIYYETHGDGEPIVFVYGLACLINHWHHQIKYFSKTNKVIVFDLRGHHQSTPVNNIKHLRLNDMTKDISFLLKHLNVTKAHFVGHSFGVPVLLQLYFDYPDLMKSAVHINGFAKNPIKGMFGLDVIEPFYYFFRSQFELQPELMSSIWKAAVDNPISMYGAALAGGFNLSLTHLKDIEVYTRGVGQMNLNVFLNIFGELLNFDVTDELNKINLPSLIVSGEKDSVTPAKYQIEFHKKIPNSEFLFVKYGSHCTQLDFPDYINLKIEKFFSTIK